MPASIQGVVASSAVGFRGQCGAQLVYLDVAQVLLANVSVQTLPSRAVHGGRIEQTCWQRECPVHSTGTAYVRSVATLAQMEGIGTCVIYRAALAGVPRDSCTYMEDVTITCAAILEGHRAYDRAHQGRAEISIPAGPNCHHSVRIPTWG
jgi:hypothetical protein